VTQSSDLAGILRPQSVMYVSPNVRSSSYEYAVDRLISYASLQRADRPDNPSQPHDYDALVEEILGWRGNLGTRKHDVSKDGPAFRTVQLLEQCNKSNWRSRGLRHRPMSPSRIPAWHSLSESRAWSRLTWEPIEGPETSCAAAVAHRRAPSYIDRIWPVWPISGLRCLCVG
jgi:hypothetical protein